MRQRSTTGFLGTILRQPRLTRGEERELLRRLRGGDGAAAAKLVASHLRFVIHIAKRYRRDGLPLADLIQEGTVGLLEAVKRFNPERDVQLSTYSMWWIRAAIQEYVLRSWSLVKIGTTSAQKRLFFNLRKIKGQIAALDDGALHPDQIKHIADTLNVTAEEVVSMNQRLTGDASLNVPMRADEGASQWQDWLVDETTDQETALGETEEFDERMGMLNEAMGVLNDREKAILTARRLEESPKTLEDLAQEFGVSRERIRQIEVRAFEKIQAAVQDAAAENQRDNEPA